MALVTDHIGYIVERMLIGWALASFVVCQFWSSMMFSPNVVGTANSIVGGWGNAGTPLCLSHKRDGIVIRSRWHPTSVSAWTSAVAQQCSGMCSVNRWWQCAQGCCRAVGGRTMLSCCQVHLQHGGSEHSVFSFCQACAH